MHISSTWGFTATFKPYYASIYIFKYKNEFVIVRSLK